MLRHEIEKTKTLSDHSISSLLTTRFRLFGLYASLMRTCSLQSQGFGGQFSSSGHGGQGGQSGTSEEELVASVVPTGLTEASPVVSDIGDGVAGIVVVTGIVVAAVGVTGEGVDAGAAVDVGGAVVATVVVAAVVVASVVAGAGVVIGTHSASSIAVMTFDSVVQKLEASLARGSRKAEVCPR